MRQHRNLEGFEQLRHAAALRPGRFMASGRLGQAHEQLGLLPEAIAAYWQELAVRPAAPEARMRLGGALAKAGQPAAALEELEGALSAGWASPDLWINLGLALDSLDRCREAMDRFGQALQASPRGGRARPGSEPSPPRPEGAGPRRLRNPQGARPDLAERLRREFGRS